MSGSEVELGEGNGRLCMGRVATGRGEGGRYEVLSGHTIFTLYLRGVERVS